MIITTIKKVFYHLCFLAIAFWWVPFSLSSDHEEMSQREDYMAEHIEDGYVQHFGGVTLYLPVILYKQGSGIYVFSSRHLYARDSHHQNHRTEIPSIQVRHRDKQESCQRLETQL